MANTLIIKNKIDGSEPASGVAAGELAIKQVAASATGSSAAAATGKLYYGEDVGDGSDPDGTVVIRDFGIGIKSDNSDTQVGVPIGGNLYIKGGTGISTAGSVSGDVATVTITASGLDNYSSWTIAADDDSSTVSSGETVTMAGTAPISTVNTSRSIAFSIDNDGITDTHLAYNTGQHLTTSSSVQFGELDVDNWNLNSTTLELDTGSMKIHANDDSGGNDGEIYLHSTGGAVYMRSGTSSGNWNRFIFSLGLSESIITSHQKMKLVTGSSSDFTVDSTADIILDAESGTIACKDGGTKFASIYNNSGNGQFRMFEGANYVGFAAPALSANQIWVLPTADGSDGHQLTTDGSGTLSWAASGGDAYTAGDGLTLNTLDFDLDAALTTVTSVVNTGLEIGRDADNRIKFGTDNQIIFEVSGGDNVIMKASGEIEATKFDGALEGNADTATLAATATALASARTFRTNLASTSTASFDGTGNVTPGVTGTLAVGSGGTGATTLSNLITLTTHTSGNYVGTITGGDGITSSAATSGEGTTHSLSAADVLYNTAGLGAPDNLGTLTNDSASGDKLLIYDISGTPAWKQVTAANLFTNHGGGGGGSGTINSGSTNEVAHYTGSTTVDGHSGFTYDPSGQNVAIGNHLTAASATLSGTLEIDVGSGDPIIIFDTQGADKFTIGVDDSDADSFKINSGGSLATTSDFRMDSSGNVTIQGSLTGASLDISGNCDIDGTMEADAITINGTGIGSIYSPVAGHSSIATVGTIGTGVWQGTAIASGYIANDAVTLAKMASGTDGNIISYDASGNPVAIATGSDGQVLTSTGAGSPPAFENAASGAVLLDDITAGDASATLEVSSGDITIGARDQGVLKLDSIGFVKVLETKTSDFTPAEDACAYWVHCSADPGPSGNKSFRIDLQSVSSPVGGQTYEFFCEATSSAVAGGNATITIYGHINDTPGPSYKEITICTAASSVGADINKHGYARATYVDGSSRTGGTNTWFVLVAQQGTDRTSGVLGMD